MGLPPRLRRALDSLPAADAFKLAAQFLAASEEDQAGMMEFIDDDGPRRVREIAVQARDGTPTAGDLEEWLDA